MVRILVYEDLYIVNTRCNIVSEIKCSPSLEVLTKINAKLNTISIAHWHKITNEKLYWSARLFQECIEYREIKRNKYVQLRGRKQTDSNRIEVNKHGKHVPWKAFERKCKNVINITTKRFHEMKKKEEKLRGNHIGPNHFFQCIVVCVCVFVCAYPDIPKIEQKSVFAMFEEPHTFRVYLCVSRTIRKSTKIEREQNGVFFFFNFTILGSYSQCDFSNTHIFFRVSC